MSDASHSFRNAVAEALCGQLHIQTFGRPPSRDTEAADDILEMYEMRAIQRLIKDVAYEKPEWLSHVSMPACVVDWAMGAP